MYNHLLGFMPYQRHFDKLIVHESILFKTAVGSAGSMKSREDFQAELSSFISSLISCDQLELIFYERPPEEGPKWMNEYPREIIEHICKKWKVKSIVIVISRAADNKKPCRAQKIWQDKPFLTSCDFLSDAYQRPLSAYQLDFVEIKLNSGIRKIEDDFEKLLVNTNNLFPAKQYFLKNLEIPISNIFFAKIEKSIKVDTRIRMNCSIDKNFINFTIPES